MARLLSFFLFLAATPTAWAQAQFTERSIAAGLEFTYQEMLLMGGGAAAFDFDNDGDEDLYVVGGGGHDVLFENDGTGNFTDVSVQYGIPVLTQSSFTTSVTTGDIDNDGRREIFVGTVGPAGGDAGFDRNLMLKFDTISQQYKNVAIDYGLYDASFCMGGHFFDVNNDSYLDLFVANGYVNSALDKDGLRQTDRLFLGNNSHTFEDQTVASGVFYEGLSRGAITADFNQDGRPDILTVTNDILFPGPTNFLQYYQNTSMDLNNWISFKLEGQKSNRDAYGTKVLIFSDNRKLLKEVSGGSSHASQNSSVVHFGLGSLTKVDSVQIFWPGAKMETIFSPSINELSYIKQKEEKAETISGPGITENDFKIAFNPTTKEITLGYEGQQFQQVELLVSDQMGRVIIRNDFLMTNGQEKIITLGKVHHLFFCFYKK